MQPNVQDWPTRSVSHPCHILRERGGGCRSTLPNSSPVMRSCFWASDRMTRTVLSTAYLPPHFLSLACSTHHPRSKRRSKVRCASLPSGRRRPLSPIDPTIIQIRLWSKCLEIHSGRSAGIGIPPPLWRTEGLMGGNYFRLRKRSPLFVSQSRVGHLDDAQRDSECDAADPGNRG